MSPRTDMSARSAREGDWIEVNVIGGGPNRRGQILEVLGAPGHEHYRVRWDEVPCRRVSSTTPSCRP